MVPINNRRPLTNTSTIGEKNMIDILVPVIIILVVVIVFLKISVRARKRGGSMTSVVLGSTYELHSQDRRKAMEVVLQRHAGQKNKEQDSGDSDDDSASRLNYS